MTSSRRSGRGQTWSSPKETRKVKITIAVAGSGESIPTINLAIEANTTMTTDSSVRWTNVPNDDAVLTSASVTPSVAVINACLPGQILTVEFPETSETLVPGQIYWLVLRDAGGSTGTTIWYATHTSQIGTATSSQYGEWWENDVLVSGWISYVPGLYVPNAFRVEVR